jgi:hypothetical protein
MPYYFFNIKHDSTIVEDQEGARFDDLASAKEEAQESLRELVAEAIRAKSLDLPNGIDIRDDVGTLVAEVTVDDLVPHANGL